MDENMDFDRRTPETGASQNDNAQKRTASDAALDGQDIRSTRKRAAKACQSCRSRKVRCSVSDHGVPCYNCKLDELECIIPERKRPTRTAKREKSLGSVISEAVLRMDNTSSETSSFQSNMTRRPSSTSIHGDWEKSFAGGYGVDTPSAAMDSPPQDVGLASHELRNPEFDKVDFTELPPCDEELARWFGVMPARVVDKMFEYLALLSQCGQAATLPSRLRQSRSNSHDKVRLIPPGSNKRKALSPEIQDRLRCHITPQPNQYTNAPFPLEPLSPQSPTEETCPSSATHDSQRNMALLNQLRDSHAAASRTISTLEATIRKVDAQLASRRDPRYNPSNCRFPSTGAFPHSVASAKKTTPPTLTPPPENNQDAYEMSIQTLQQLEKLFAPPTQGQHDEGAGKQDGAAEVLDGGLGARDEDFQDTFESLIDFGTDDALFQIA
ncbi:predicted protein [Uncinocarpus reesii 1704]|uniref:Zn(2)-C6 fungal-type domain-containing protein n=1 Tax=Uncinocarpus reesii (strain UAMH 1704) TaxID=336963 RepID=C4JH45_UNCRE|nr:uncharacterized protein UREG_02618 [Uncinocarpus reesii 1704]EEP77769.1 predicted protein [Uncinocarpus reesii 1704]